MHCYRTLVVEVVEESRSRWHTRGGPADGELDALLGQSVYHCELLSS
jgi:hypothetical protein